MRDAVVRAALALGVAGLLAAACSGDAGPTTTEFIPPTSEVIFTLTTTTTTPPGPLDPVYVASLDVTIDIPQDWEFRTDDGLQFGRASALYRAENDSGGLIVVGAIDDLVPDVPSATAMPDDLASLLATLLDVASPLPDDALRKSAGPVDGTSNGINYVLTTYGVTESNGADAVMEIAVYRGLDPPVFVAVLYQQGFPPGRIEQTRVFDSLAVDDQ